mgnify:FL=1
MADTVMTARFVSKADHVQELADDTAYMVQMTPFQVVKVIELTSAQYRHYAAHLDESAPFILANMGLMGRDSQGVSHCLLVTDRGRMDGILVNAEGHPYARYAAYVMNKTWLDLRDVPIDHYNLTVRGDLRGRDR